MIKNKKITLSKKYDGEEYKNTFTKDFLKDALYNRVMNNKLHFTGKVFYHGRQDRRTISNKHKYYEQYCWLTIYNLFWKKWKAPSI